MPEHPTEDLAAFVTRMGGERSLRVEENLGQGYVRLLVAEAERRQAAHDIRCVEDAVIEMLRNARDAGAKRIFVATSRTRDRRTTCMLDDGEGIPHELQQAVFDARVTSKLESVHEDRWGVHGRGMALYSIRENSLEAAVAISVPGGGCAIRIVTDTTALAERADQSSWPKLGTDEDGNPALERGPHNIIRTCCEFALEEKGKCQVFVGSPAEMVATIRSRARDGLSATEAILSNDLDELPVLTRFCVASDAAELCDVARGCGIDLSQRTTQRILSGQIRPVPSVMSHIGHKKPGARRAPNLVADQRGLKLASDDSQEFTQMLERDFEYLAQRYYLHLTSKPRIRVSGNRMTVVFEYEGED